MGRFTDEQLNYIKKRYTEDGVSVNAIALELNTCHRTISKYLNLMYIPVKNRRAILLTEQQLDYIKKRYCEDGVSINTIAKEFKLQHEVITRRLKQMGVVTCWRGPQAKYPMVDGKKVCLNCQQEKPVSEFTLIPTKEGYTSWCRECNNKRAIEIHRRNTPRLTKYDDLYEKQHGVCAICHRPETRKLYGKIIALAVDHNHATGEVRGLLCADCNRALGMLQDSPELCSSAADYLRGYNQ